MPELLSKKQVMDEYGLGRHLLDKAMREHQISYIKLERRVLFRREHIEEFLMKNTVEAIPLSEKFLKKLKKRAKKYGRHESYRPYSRASDQNFL